MQLDYNGGGGSVKHTNQAATKMHDATIAAGEVSTVEQWSLSPRVPELRFVVGVDFGYDPSIGVIATVLDGRIVNVRRVRRPWRARGRRLIRAVWQKRGRR